MRLLLERWLLFVGHLSDADAGDGPARNVEQVVVRSCETAGEQSLDLLLDLLLIKSHDLEADRQLDSHLENVWLLL